MRKFLGLVPALLLAGCHSAQVSLKPAATLSELMVAAPATVPLDSALTATVVAPRPAALRQLAAGPAAQVPVGAVPHLLHRREAAPLSEIAKVSAAAKATFAAPAAKRLGHRLQRQRPTEGAAENGLGRVALFFIAVVLAVLAGLAALVGLIPGVSFWGGLGLAVAGLVVIFLLYSLLSGGKKKK